MASLDKETVKKHHFWFLLIPVLIGLLLAWIGLFFGVSDATAAKKKENEAEKGKIDSAKAQSRKTLGVYDERKGVLYDLRTKRWEEMWQLQQTMFTLPPELGDDQLAIAKKYKFGDNITEQSLLAAFREHYAKGYETIAKVVTPVQFNNGWQNVFRHVRQDTWRRLPEPEDIWLALEDFWVQREIVSAIAKVNDDAARFYPPSAFPDGHWMKSRPDTPTKRSFLSKLWYVELEIADVSGGRAIKGKLQNVTNRLLPFGVNNELLLNISLSDSPNARPFAFSIEGVSLEGGKTEDIKFIPRKHQIFDQQIKGLIKVEQVFDIRSAPVKRIEKLALGYLSSRHSDIALQMSTFSKKNFDTESAASGTDPNTPAGVPPGGPGEMSGPPGGLGALGGATQTASKDFTANGLTRKRYINRTDQVRGMPLAGTVLVDQNFVQDVITSLGNCKLRFQTVQAHENRFRGTLSYVVPTSGSPGSEVPPPGVGMPPGSIPGGPPGGRGEEEGGETPGRPGAPPRGGSAGGPPPGMGIGGRPGIGGPGSPGAPGGETPGFPGFPGGNFPGFPGGSSGGAGNLPRSSSEDNVATNLVELSVYGIASLYEKFVPPEKKEGATETPVTPVQNPPMPEAPMGTPMGTPPAPMMPPTGTPMPMPGTPMPPVDPKNPKM